MYVYIYTCVLCACVSQWSRDRFQSIASEDGTIPIDEWKTLVEVSEKFDYYDTDSDGFLSPQELGLLLNESGYVDEEMLAKYIAGMMIKKTDINNDGKLDYGEFIRVYRALAKNYQVDLGAEILAVALEPNQPLPSIPLLDILTLARTVPLFVKLLSPSLTQSCNYIYCLYSSLLGWPR